MSDLDFLGNSLDFLGNFDYTLNIELKDKLNIELIELVINKPIEVIFHEHIYKYLIENYDLILRLNILTQKERELLKDIKENESDIWLFFSMMEMS